MTYALLAVPFLLASIGIGWGAAVLARRWDPSAKVSVAAVGIALAVLIVLTAVFDNVIIGVGLVDYDQSTLTGVMVGVAPIEDFAYSIAAALMLPGVWIMLRAWRGRSAA